MKKLWHVSIYFGKKSVEEYNVLKETPKTYKVYLKDTKWARTVRKEDCNRLYDLYTGAFFDDRDAIDKAWNAKVLADIERLETKKKELEALLVLEETK